jgi:hypothetical protein
MIKKVEDDNVCRKTKEQTASLHSRSLGWFEKSILYEKINLYYTLNFV